MRPRLLAQYKLAEVGPGYFRSERPRPAQYRRARPVPARGCRRCSGSRLPEPVRDDIAALCRRDVEEAAQGTAVSRARVTTASGISPGDALRRSIQLATWPEWPAFCCRRGRRFAAPCAPKDFAIRVPRPAAASSPRSNCDVADRGRSGSSSLFGGLRRRFWSALASRTGRMSFATTWATSFSGAGGRMIGPIS